MKKLLKKGKVCRRSLSLLLTFALLFGMTAGFSVSASAADVTWNMSSGTLNATNGNTYVISGGTVTGNNATSITVADNATVTLRFTGNTTIDKTGATGANARAAISLGNAARATVQIDSGVTVTLRGSNGGFATNNPNAKNNNPAQPPQFGGHGAYAGINVPSGASLIVSGMGTLYCYGGSSVRTNGDKFVEMPGTPGAGAGIGGNGGNGGSSAYGAHVQGAIYGGDGGSGQTAGDITITTARVYAYGGSSIRGGYGNYGGGGGSGYPAAGIGGGGGGGGGGGNNTFNHYGEGYAGGSGGGGYNGGGGGENWATRNMSTDSPLYPGNMGGKGGQAATYGNSSSNGSGGGGYLSVGISTFGGQNAGGAKGGGGGLNTVAGSRGGNGGNGGGAGKISAYSMTLVTAQNGENNLVLNSPQTVLGIGGGAGYTDGKAVSTVVPDATRLDLGTLMADLHLNQDINGGKPYILFGI